MILREASEPMEAQAMAQANLSTVFSPVSPATSPRSPTPATRGDPQAPNELLDLLYGELRRLARCRLAHHALSPTVDPSELVHEAYLRIAGDGERCFEGPRHFFFAASRAMHDILVESLRARESLKRGGRCRQILFAVPAQAPPSPTLRLDLHLALARLRGRHPDQAQIVVLRCFGGLTIAEISEATGSSPATVKRRWNRARAWLRRELSCPVPTTQRSKRPTPCRPIAVPNHHEPPRSIDSAKSS